MYLQQAKIKRKNIRFPLYLPDATRAVVRSLSNEDLKQAGTEAVVVNTYHLLLNPGLSVLKQFGGVKKFMNYEGLVVSDSGGFQIMSLIHQQKTWGKITEEGVQFKWRQNGIDEKILFTPEKSIQTQFAIGSDIIVSFDYFTDPRATKKEQELSVALTSEWAARGKEEYMRQLKKRRIKKADKPWLMGVIQGGDNFALRKESADALLSLDFDLYGYGGWPMDKDGRFDYRLFEYNASLTPDEKPRFALGVGMPENIARGVGYGYQFFDCVLPTRDARHGRLYVRSHSQKGETFLHINKGRYSKDKQPISKSCGCFTCRHHSRAYLYHLFKIQDGLYFRLASIHNLYFYQSLVKGLNP